MTPDAASDRCNVIWSTSPMADNSLLPLSADEKAALAAALKRLIDGDRYPVSPRVRTLEVILARLQPPKPPAPLPLRKHHEPPRHTPAQRRAR
jgi:hypothetical protein